MKKCDKSRYLSQILNDFNEQARNQKFFKAGEVLWNSGTSTNFSSRTQKKAPQRKSLELFLLDTLKTTF